jgi:hypothetical protein
MGLRNEHFERDRAYFRIGGTPVAAAKASVANPRLTGVQALLRQWFKAEVRRNATAGAGACHEPASAAVGETAAMAHDWPAAAPSEVRNGSTAAIRAKRPGYLHIGAAADRTGLRTTRPARTSWPSQSNQPGSLVPHAGPAAACA